MDNINNNLSTRKLSPEIKELLSKRTSSEIVAEDKDLESSKGQVAELTADLQSGEITQDQNIVSDISEVIATTMQQNTLGTINFNNNTGFGSGQDDGHDTSEAQKIKTQLMASN